MNKFDFDLHLIENLDYALFYIFISGLVSYLLMRKNIYSIFDPLFFGMIMASCAYSTVLYSHHFDLISNYYFYSFILTQSFFFFGFLLNKPILKSDYSHFNINYGRESDISPAFFIYILGSCLFILSQLIVYYVSGIPLLMESRLEMYAGGGGYGLLGRIIYVTSIISLSFASYRLFFMKNKLLSNFYDYFIVLFSIMVAALSGSKAGILILLFTVFITLFFGRKINFNKKTEKKFQKIAVFLLVLLIPVAFLTLYIQLGFEGIDEILISLALRFVHSGDIFFMSYPNDVLMHLNTNDNGIFALFRSILGALRIVSREDLPVNLGLQVYWYQYDTDLISGPNARHNVFGLFYFGFIGSLFFSFSVGYIFGFVRNRLYKKLKPTQTNVILYTLLVMSINYAGQDPSGQAIEYLFSVLLIFTPLYFISLMLYAISKKNHKESNEKYILNNSRI